MKPGHAVILERDRASALFAIRCDPAACPVRRPPEAGMPDGQIVARGLCQHQGCWLTSSFTAEGAERLIAKHGFSVTARRL